MRLSKRDQALWLWLACTGMRLGEPFQITEEHEEEGIRYVKIGTKTPSSKRRVPIPELVIPHISNCINGPIFRGRPAAASNRILNHLKNLGISYDSSKCTGSKSKVIHSLRHRAKDRLRAVGCPLEIQYELLGHERVTLAKNYGLGSPMSILKHWIDKIMY
ncbi:tyrosine-type recombinase/integrase [Methylobacterium sp. J-092]|uniref:tyrosine-type recombinase/integrase n=1 Tax=Methylobacterium sp. J-092 TaxID=2836667 RepID=UPI00391AA20A